MVLSFALLVVTALIVAVIAILHRSFEDAHEAAVDRAAMQSGGKPPHDVRLPMDQVLPLLQPLDHTKTDWARHFSVAGRDAFVLQWRRVLRGATEYGAADVWHAYLVLGCGGPHLRVYPKALFGKPADCVQVTGDPVFSKRFHVQARDQEAVRWYLGPALRRFLLAQAGWWSFHAEPHGVALVAEGEIPGSETPQMRMVLERLLAAVEAARIG